MVTNFHIKRLSLRLIIKAVLLAMIEIPLILGLQNAQRMPIVPFYSHIILCIYIFSFIFLLPFIRIKLTRIKILLIGSWIVLFFIALLSSLWSSNPELVIQRSLMVFITSIILFIIVFADHEPLGTYYNFLQFLSWFGISLALIGLVIHFLGNIKQIDGAIIGELIIGSLRLEQRVYGVSPFYRISSLTGNPNSLAMLLFFSLLATFTLFFAKQINLFKFLVSSTIQLIALGFTLSRTGIGITLLSFILFYSLSAKNYLKKYLRAIVIILICFLLFLIFWEVAPSWLIDGIKQRLGSGLNLRDEIWKPLINSIVENPVIGVGFGVSSEAILLPQGIEKSSHNIHLAVLAEIGIVGYLVLLCIWFFAMIVGLKYGIKESIDRKLRFAFLSNGVMLFGLLVHQFFEAIVFRFGSRHFLWVYLVGVVISLYCFIPTCTNQQSKEHIFKNT